MYDVARERAIMSNQMANNDIFSIWRWANPKKKKPQTLACHRQMLHGKRGWWGLEWDWGWCGHWNCQESTLWWCLSLNHSLARTISLSHSILLSLSSPSPYPATHPALAASCTDAAPPFCVSVLCLCVVSLCVLSGFMRMWQHLWLSISYMPIDRTW